MSNVIRVQVLKQEDNGSRTIQDIFEFDEQSCNMTNALRRAKRDVFRSDQYSVGDEVTFQANRTSDSSVCIRTWMKPASWRN